MGFSQKQVSALRRSLNREFVRIRKIGGREFSYIEGWHAITEANRIFGHDGWDRETVESRCVQSREHRGTLFALYIAKVRISVRVEAAVVVREGYGTGEGQGASLGEVHERALKMAETDATKRALATFGNPFGLGLYVSSRNGRDRRPANPPIASPPIADADRRRTFQRLGANGRYYVPKRTLPVLEPAFKLASRSETALDHQTEHDSVGEPAPPLTPKSLPSTVVAVDSVPSEASDPTPDQSAPDPVRESDAVDRAAGEDRIKACTAIIDARIGNSEAAAIAYNNRGIAYAVKGDYDLAIADYDFALKLNSTYSKALNNRGIAFQRKGDLDRAITDFTEAMALETDYGKAVANRAVTYEKKGVYTTSR